MTVQQEVAPQWQTYLDVHSDVRPWLQLGETPETTVDRKLQLVTDMACQWVQQYLGKPIAPTRFFRRFSGGTGFNGAHIDLPYFPVLEVVEVVEYWGSSGAHHLVEQTPAQQGNSEMFQLDPVRGRLTRTFTGLVQRPWFPGERNIEVTWVAGYNPIPKDVEIATLEFIAHWWRNTQQAARTTAIPAGYEYDPATAGSMLWAGVPDRVKALISSYEQLGIG
jgi:hypothetical protein